MKIRSLALASLFALSAVHAATISGKFSTDPALAGWQVFGDTNLFQWNPTNQALDVTWDSAQPNSYFYHPLGAVYTKTNDFLITFDLQLNDIAIGTTLGHPLTFELAVGLINAGEATSGNYFRGDGYFPDLVEFDYFPNDLNDFGATLSTIMISSQINYSKGGFTDPLELATNTLYHVTLIYTAINQTLRTVMTADGAKYGPIMDTYLPLTFDDFQVDAISVNSYNDGGQDPSWAGSILAHGSVRNLAFASPLPVGVIKTTAAGQVRFGSDTNWLYTLEQTADLKTWTPAAPATGGTGTNLVLQATNVPPGKSFYRVRADLP